jgi:hypothetical protein
MPGIDTALTTLDTALTTLDRLETAFSTNYVTQPTLDVKTTKSI